MNCAKDGPAAWSECHIPSNHPMFSNDLLKVPALLEIPLVIHRVGTQSSYRGSLDCQIATFLNVEPDDGLALPEWQSGVGTCIVARKDKKPLSQEQLEIVWMYIDRLMEVFGDNPAMAPKMWSRKLFEHFFARYKRDEVSQMNRKEFESVKSLYDV